MKFLFGSKSGSVVPALAESLRQLQDTLEGKQKEWAEQLSNDPASFAQLEQQIHLTFDQLADHTAASLLAHAAQQDACAEAAKKK